MSDPLWITYAWKDNDEGDFDYLVQSLAEAGVSAIYDKIALSPGRRLWDQIGARITTHPLSGRAYLLTPHSLISPACLEELAYALDRAHRATEEEFALIGLLHQVSVKDVPVSLRVRLCINLANPDWKEEVRAAVEGRPPRREVAPVAPFVMKVHPNYLGRGGVVAVEFRPRFGEIMNCRIGFPSAGPRPVEWGSGPANSGGISPAKFGYVEGTGLVVNEVTMDFVGAANTLSASISAYVVFGEPVPECLYFAVSQETFGKEMTGTFFFLPR